MEQLRRFIDLILEGPPALLKTGVRQRLFSLEEPIRQSIMRGDVQTIKKLIKRGVGQDVIVTFDNLDRKDDAPDIVSLAGGEYRRGYPAKVSISLPPLMRLGIDPNPRELKLGLSVIATTVGHELTHHRQDIASMDRSNVDSWAFPDYPHDPSEIAAYAHEIVDYLGPEQVMDMLEVGGFTLAWLYDNVPQFKHYWHFFEDPRSHRAQKSFKRLLKTIAQMAMRDARP